MRRIVVYLMYNKAHPIDRKEFMAKYSNTAQSKFAPSATYSMMKGTPILVNVEGTLIEADTLPEILKNRYNAEDVNKFMSCIKSDRPNAGLPSQLQFRWSFNAWKQFT